MEFDASDPEWWTPERRALLGVLLQGGLRRDEAARLRLEDLGGEVLLPHTSCMGNQGHTEQVRYAAPPRGRVGRSRGRTTQMRYRTEGCGARGSHVFGCAGRATRSESSIWPTPPPPTSRRG